MPATVACQRVTTTHYLWRSEPEVVDTADIADRLSNA
jgi:hypothetical protein